MKRFLALMLILGIASNLYAVNPFPRRLISDENGTLLDVDANGNAEVSVEDMASSSTTANFNMYCSTGNAKVETYQKTHDDMNVNANVQQGNADIGYTNPLRVDLSSSTAYGCEDCNALKVINHVNAIAHAGYTFEASTRVIGLADDGFLMVYVVLGSSNAHITFEVGCEGKAYIDGYSLPTVTSSGTVMLSTSKNFVDLKTKTLMPYFNPTVTSSGTLVFTDILFGGEGNKSVGGSAGEAQEWISNAGATFLLKIQNVAGSAKDVLFRMFWKEEKP